MLISTMTKAYAEEYGYIEAIKRLAKIGFDCLDLTLTHFESDDCDPLLCDGYKQLAEKMRKTAEECEISFNQCHAPYFHRADMERLFTDSETHEKIVSRTLRAIEIAGIVGAKAVVIHPIHVENYNTANKTEALKANLKFYGEFISAAKAAGVKIAVENMWRKQLYTGAIIADVCSNPYELAEYVDTLNSHFGGGFTACLDIGHCALTGVDPAAAIIILGDRLGALHIHDNDAKADEHLIPGSRIIDFTSVMLALKDINYKGEFTYEADKFIKLHSVSEYDAAAKQLYKKAMELIKIIE